MRRQPHLIEVLIPKFKFFAPLLFLASPLIAQSPSPLICSASAGAPALVRTEGLAERVSDIVLTCRGGNSGAPPQVATMTLFFGTAVTSRQLTASCCGSEALVLINDLAGGPVVGANVIQGQPSGNSISFANVPVPVPGSSGTTTIRITNLRVNASALLAPGTSVQAFLSISGAPIPLVSSQFVVGITAPGSIFSLQTPQGQAVANLSFQSAPQNAALATNPFAAGGTLTHQIAFSAGFDGSFRKRNAATTLAAPTATADQGTPGTDYHTESGFYLSSLPSTGGLNTAGLATQGTRLIARFNNVPAGVAIYVTTTPLPNTGGTAARLISTDSSGAGTYTPVAAVTSIDSGGTAAGIAPVTITNGAGMAVWEIVDTDTAQNFVFGVVEAYQSSVPGVATVSGQVGPITPAFGGDNTSPVPRFSDTAGTAAACTANPCLTAAPAAFSLNYQTGTARPGPFHIQLNTTVSPGLPYQATLTTSQNGWISVANAFGATSGATPDSLTLTLTPEALTPGVYQATVVISSPSQQFQPVTIPVILTVVTGPSGFIPFGCTTNAAITPILRHESRTDALGDLVLVCNNGIPAQAGVAVPKYDVQVTLPTPVTSRTYASGWSEALLIIDEPGTPGINDSATLLACSDNSGVCALSGNGTGVKYDGSPGHPNVFPGLVSGNTVTFPGVPLDAPGVTGDLASGQRVIRIVNIRTDVTGVAIDPVFGRTALKATVSAGNLAIAQSSPVVGYVAPTLTPSFRLPDDSGASAGVSLSYTASTPQAAGVFRFSNFSIATALKARGTPPVSPWSNPDVAPTPVVQDIPGALYPYGETDFYAPALTSPLVNFTSVGLADSGTRLRAQIDNIPAGARVFVSTRPVAFSNGVPAVLNSTLLVRLTQSEAGVFSAAPVATTLNGIPAAELTVNNGTAVAVWEVVASSFIPPADLDFLIWAEGSGPTANAATATLSYAPSSAAGSAIPRFAAGTAALPLFTFGVTVGFATSATLPSGAVGIAYNQAISGAYGTLPYRYAVTDGSVPPGLTLNDSGGLSGTPTQAGSFSFTVQVTDATGSSASQVFSLIVQAAAALSVSQTHSGNFVQGANGAYTVVVSNANNAGPTSGMVTLTETVPAGMTIVSLAGFGWDCSLTFHTCTRSDVLAAGGSYQSLLVGVYVAPNAGSPLVSQAVVSGGNSPIASGSDSVTVLLANATSLTVSPALSTLSQAVTMTAVVVPGATGIVTFYDGAAVLGSAAVSGTQAVFSTTLLSFGAHRLHAHYSGDSTYGPSDSITASQTVRALPNAGFQPAATYTVGTNIYDVVVADFNKDGISDLAVLNSNFTNVSILLGQGDGTFRMAANYVIAYNCQQLAVGDFNRDGNPDLAVANGSGMVYVMLGNGDGSFGAPVPYPAEFPTGVVVGDFNGDGVPDLAVTNTGENKVGVLLGKGDGTFQPVVQYYAGNQPWRITMADFNGDGRPDLVTANTDGTVNVLLGLGDGSFAYPVTASATPAQSIVTGDWNGDGAVDVALSTSLGVELLFGKGDGSFGNGPWLSTGAAPGSLAVADFNGDGKADFIVGSQLSNMTMLLSNGIATFQSPAPIPMPFERLYVAAGDFNGDGRADFVAFDLANNVLSVVLAIPGPSLTVQSAHGTIGLGQANAVYTVTVSNAAGAGSASGTVMVTDQVPAGMTLVSMGGNGWSCNSGSNTCTRSSTLAGGSSYPPITVEVSVAANAGSLLTNVVMVVGGGSLSATVTDPTIIGPPATLTADLVSPSVGTGLAQTFLLQYSSSAGVGDVATAWVWFNATLAASAANSCLVEYTQASNVLSLLNDAGTLWLTGSPGTPGTLSNSQCAINLGGMTAVSGPSLTLQLPVTFSSAFPGGKNIYMFGADFAASSGWQLRGTWTLPAVTVAADSVSPASGTGLAQTFTAQYSSTAGAADISTAWLWIAANSSSAANTCLVYYSRPSNQLNLLTDGGSLWIAATPGASTPLSNSQCSVNVAASTANLSGNTLTLTVPVAFTPGFAGPKNVYMFAGDFGGSSGWQSRGTWTVPVVAVSADSVTPNSGTASLGVSQTFSLQYSSTIGYSDISTAWVWFTDNFAGSPANSCMVHYNRALNQLNLLTDGGSTWISATLGAGGALSNRSCSLDVSGATAVGNGNTLTLNVPVTFTSLFNGTKNVYMFATDAGGINSAWQNRGSWTVPKQILPVAVVPASGSGFTQTFTLSYGTNAGASNFSTGWVWFTSNFAGSPANTCMLYFNKSTSQLNLLSDGGQTWVQMPLGVNSSLSNSQCSVNPSVVTAIASGTTVTLTLPVTFTAAFAGTRSIYVYGNDNTGASSGWQNLGQWTVPTLNVTADSVTPNAPSGRSNTLVLQYSSSAGAADISTAWVWINSSFGASAANSCMAYYDRVTNRINLLTDGGSTWISAVMGTPVELSNSQCSIQAAAAAVSSGNTLTVTLPVTFALSYSGTKNIYLFANDAVSNSGWQNRGTWTFAPLNMIEYSVLPSAGSGLQQTFTLHYFSSYGVTNVATLWAWFSPAFANPANSCMVYYDRAGGVVNLLRDNGSTWMGAPVASGGILSNSQCSINVANVVVSSSADTLAVDLPITFTTAFAGAKNIYIFASDPAVTNQWQTGGSWTVPGQ